LSAPSEFLFTWDIVNAWKMGTYPTVEVYEALRPLLGYVHVKGGQAAADDPAKLKWKVGLDEASWPVREVIQAVVDDGVSPVICLNPAHGEWKTDYDYGDGSTATTPFRKRNLAPVTGRDIDFLRRNVEGDRVMSYQRDFERRVRIGVVGVGDHAYRNILPLLTFLPVEFVAVADTNSELGAKPRSSTGGSRTTKARPRCTRTRRLTPSSCASLRNCTLRSP